MGCTFVVWDHDVTADQWHEHVARLLSDPAFPPGPLWLTDLRRAGGAPQIARDFIEDMGIQLNSSDSALRQGIEKVAIVPNGAWDKAIQLVDDELAIPRLRAILFNDLEGAAGWLGLPVDRVNAILNEMYADPTHNTA
jgi:hypothetical protein